MSYSLSSSVWDRTEDDDYSMMSERAYITAVTLFTVAGLIISSVVACNTYNPTYNTQLTQLDIIHTLLMGLILPIAGIFMALRSEQWSISLLGYVMVVVGLGIIIGLVVALYEFSLVINALLATTGVTIVMSVIGILFPGLLRSWGGYLFGALLALLFAHVGEIVLAALDIPISAGWQMLIGYVGAVLFSLYIIFDWGRALQIPYTLDNAIDSALAIYLDIVNLFLHLLQAMGTRSND